MKMLGALVCAVVYVSVAHRIWAADTFTVRTMDTGAALVNPGMGWTLHFYSNIPSNYGSRLEPSDTVEDFPGLSTVYLRLPWAYLEPEEGRFNWAILDTPAQRWIANGKRVALRLTCSENWMKYATPEWVKQAGAQGTFYQYGKGRDAGGDAWDPHFDDPVFLEKLNAFLAALARRYDGNPNVAFMDIGTYGLWGEGHTHASSRQDSLHIKKLHIDAHLKHFRRTLLCISDDFAGHDTPGHQSPITDYALSKGVTIRDDSIMVQPPPRSWYHGEMAQAFWPVLPVILEHEHYGSSKNRKAWDAMLLLKAVEDYHASYMSIHWWPRILLEENRNAIHQINQRLGYRLQPVEITWPKIVEIGKRFNVEWTWCNRGVAPCYPGGFPALTLKDSKGGIVSVMVDDTFNMRDLHVAPPGKILAMNHASEFVIGRFAPTTKPGPYELYVSVGARDGTPQLSLPIKDRDGQKRYRVGNLTLEARKPIAEPNVRAVTESGQSRESSRSRTRVGVPLGSGIGFSGFCMRNANGSIPIATPIPIVSSLGRYCWVK